MGRVYQLLARLCVLIWIVMPCLGQSINNVLHGNGATFVNTAADNIVYLYGNKTAVHKGKLYSFPQSTSAGITELQQAIPVVNSPGPAGLYIQLANNQDYGFTAPFIISNHVRIVGAGCRSSGFTYYGSTNLWGSPVTGPVNGFTNAIEHIVNFPWECGLITVTTNNFSNQGAANGTHVDFENFYIKISTNFPTVLLVNENGNDFRMFKCGIFGPDILTGTNANYASAQPFGGFGYPTNAQSTLGLYTSVFTHEEVNSCEFYELGAGYDCSGSTGCYLMDVFNECISIGDLGNTFPINSAYGLAPMFYLENGILSGTLIENQTQKEGVGYLLNGTSHVAIRDFTDQSPVTCTIADFGGSKVLVDKTGDLENGFGQITNAAQTNAIILRGFNVDPNNASDQWRYIDGRPWTWVAAQNSYILDQTNGIFFDSAGTNFSGNPAWLWTNSLFHNVVIEAVAIISQTTSPVGSPPLSIGHIFDGLNGIVIPRAQSQWTNALSVNISTVNTNTYNSHVIIRIVNPTDATKNEVIYNGNMIVFHTP